MPENPLDALLGPKLSQALSKKRYTQLTSVQQAVLDPELLGKDLRISSQTGSGKTLAIGFVLRAQLEGRSEARSVPRALVVTPTRELAKQVETELSWLYAPSKIAVTSLTGGASYRDEHRALAAGPGIVVGTPGRLLDHLRRGSLDPKGVEAVVLDEADRMLDLGFRAELEAILALMTPGHRTHLVSATFDRDVLTLANRVQKQAVHVEGTPLGSANTDIDHVIHLVAARERVSAVINLLLVDPGARTLIFARTRADVARLAEELRMAGFSVGSLSGEMEQMARNRAMSAFKRGDLTALVATDVAARGIDVQEIERVIQVDPPTDAETYTHRSGRTGRAGRKGTSSILVAPSALGRLTQLLKRAGVKFRTEPIPTAASIRKARDERLFQELTGDVDASDEPGLALVRRIVEAGHTERALSRLIGRLHQSGAGEPRQITELRGEAPRERSRRQTSQEDNSWAGRPHSRPPGARDPQGDRGDWQDGRNRPGPRERGRRGGPWVPFRVSFGETHGADPRRLLAMLCRRGEIRGTDMGAIRVLPTYSIVEVAASVAEGFERATRSPDSANPGVSVQRQPASDSFPPPTSARQPASVAPPPPAPHARPAKPTSNPRQPTSNPRQPASNPRQPTSNPRQPTSNPRQPTSNPRHPNARQPAPRAGAVRTFVNTKTNARARSAKKSEGRA